MPGFPPGHSTVVFYNFTFIINRSSFPSSLLKLIEPLFLITLLLSSNPFIISITNQITVLLPCLTYIYAFPLYNKPTLLYSKKTIRVGIIVNNLI